MAARVKRLSGDRREARALAYNSALLPYAKPIPKFADFVGDKGKSSAPMRGAGIRSAMDAWRFATVDLKRRPRTGPGPRKKPKARLQPETQGDPHGQQ